jgi:outer membrane protein TolC
MSCSADVEKRRRGASVALLVLAAALTWTSTSSADAEPPAAEDQAPPEAATPVRTDGARMMTEDALVASALANNPDLRAGQWEKKVAEAQVTVATAISNPVVRLEWLHAQEGLPFDVNAGWGARLAWTPPQPEEWSARRSQARARTDEVGHELLERAADLEASIRTGCATADALSEQITLAERAVTTRRAIVEVIEQRVQRGASTRFELNAAALSTVRAEQERDTFTIQRETVLLQLAALAGLPPATRIDLPPAPPMATASTQAPALPGERQLEMQALQLRPLFRADTARSEQARQLLRAEKTRRYPWFSFSSLPRVRYQELSKNMPWDLLFSIDVTLPIFDGNGGKIAAAEAEGRRQEDLRAAHVVTVRRDIDIARNETGKRRELLVRYRKTIDPILDEHAALLRDAMLGRQLDFLALLSAEDVILRTQKEYVDAELSYRKARIQLARASGEPMSALAPRAAGSAGAAAPAGPSGVPAR